MRVVLVNFEGAFLTPEYESRDETSRDNPLGHNISLTHFTGFGSELHRQYWDRLQHQFEIPETNDLNESVWKIISSLSLANYSIQFITNAPCHVGDFLLTLIRSKIARFTGWPRHSFVIHYRMSSTEQNYHFADKDFAVNAVNAIHNRSSRDDRYECNLLIDSNLFTCRYVTESLGTPCLHVPHRFPE